MIPPSKFALNVLLMSAMAFGLAIESRADVLVKSGDKIVFLGDSITHQGGGVTGWCSLVISGLKTAGVTAEQINAGRGGNTSRQMAERFEADVIAKKPAWMTLMCGTNDNPNHGLSPEESQKNITTIVEKTKAAGIKVLMITRPMRGGDPTENAYNEFIRKYAKENNVPLADVFAAMKSALADYKAKNPSLSPKSPPLLTIADGTHMNLRGNQVIAECVLQALGLTPQQIAKAKAAWPPIPAPGADSSMAGDGQK